ncbi:MAG: Mut7-C ubiquitin/RNAse domain-containing protein [Moorea sp. SIO2B7]|nr:Mut7-C ubiquitin/RNAse domain-containing protein [Moorena sp. SIO2B7]
MAQAEFRFDGELNFFLSPSQKQVSFKYYFQQHPSIKDLIEAIGVPHTEVEVILVNGEGVDFSYLVNDGDRILVYPFSSNITSNVRLRAPYLSPCFLLDVHLGKLAASLRMLGFDCLYRNDYEDEELAEISAAQQRILLTRDTGLLKRSIVTYGYYVREKNPDEQIVEVLRRFNLFESIQPCQRCVRCNGLLEAVDKELILDQLMPQTREYINEFHRCRQCGKVYWQGSHYQKMQQFIQELRQQATGNR